MRYISILIVAISFAIPMPASGQYYRDYRDYRSYGANKPITCPTCGTRIWDNPKPFRCPYCNEILPKPKPKPPGK